MVQVVIAAPSETTDFPLRSAIRPTGIDTFYVKERFGPFTHWVTVQFPQPLTMREPEARGSVPANDRVCLSDVTK